MLWMCPLHRLEFGREAAAGVANGAGSLAALRVQVSAASAPAFHRTALAPFLDNASSEAVYSPLRASMRTSASHHPFSSGGGGSSTADGAGLRPGRPAAPNSKPPDLARLERPELAAGPRLSRASSMRHDAEAEADDLSSPARRANEAYNASVYNSWPELACQLDREAGGLQSGGRPDEVTANASLGLQSHQGATAYGGHLALQQHGAETAQPQQTPTLNGLPHKALEPGVQGVAVQGQASRTGSGHGLAAPGLLLHGSVPVQVCPAQVDLNTAPLNFHFAAPLQATSSEQLVTMRMGLQETRHPDGKVERVFGDGRRATTFPNGTLKEQLADGRSNVCFTNGDVKRAFPDGRF